ncbi:hypothetical protein ACXJJ3_42205 (plasmid) [Kribbella sp. WER1]
MISYWLFAAPSAQPASPAQTVQYCLVLLAACAYVAIVRDIAREVRG